MHHKLLETLSKYHTIILVGGGTGGHIQPIITIAGELQEKQLLWIGGENSNEANEAKNQGIRFEYIPTLKLSTTRSPKIFLYPFILLKGIFEARKIILSVKSTESSTSVKTMRHPANEKSEQDFSFHSKGQIQSPSHLESVQSLSREESRGEVCIFSKGGPGSVAIGIAAWTLGIPLYIHESDTIPGRSNRVLGRLATKIFLGFESAKKYFRSERCETIGQILHPVFSSGIMNYESGIVKWKTDKKHILVICGSQGARAIFEEILHSFQGDTSYEWIIALGKLNGSLQIEFESFPDCQALPWISQENIATLLQDTDIAITRGSATTLAEIGSAGVRKIIIPLPYAADNHQYWNAKAYEETGDTLLEQKNLNQLGSIVKKYE